MGQSLCDGSESLPIVTTADTGWGNLSFKRGVRTWVYGDHAADPEQRPASDFGFIPLKAAANGGLGETMANGLADHLQASLHHGQGREAAVGKPTQFLVAYAGQGGRMIEELSVANESTDPRTPPNKKHGGGYYRTSLDDARRAVAEARAGGKDFSIGALVWMQGEANGGPTGGIVPSRWAPELPRSKGLEWYRDRLTAYRRHWSADLAAITGQHGEIPLFTYQTLGPAGEAQLMAADADPHIIMIGPHYAVPSAINSRTTNGRHGDAIHLSADGERWYGEQAGKVIHRVLAEGEDWQPLRPRKAWADPTDHKCIVVQFHVPRPPLFIDDRFLPLQQSYLGKGSFTSLAGFRVSGGLLTSVTVEPPDRVRLHLAVPIGKLESCTISYGLPFAGVLGSIAAIRPGPLVGEQATTELLVEGDLPEKLRPLLKEGAFFAMNEESGAALAQAPVRHLGSEGGQTILRFENRERRNAVDFAVGQTLLALRPFSYGNLRDSDSESATHTFGDAAYGARAGEAYPLWNWCVLFSSFPVSEAP
jgi:hypothetical protein